MRNTAKALVAGLALMMAVACAEQEETTSEQQQATASGDKADKADNADKATRAHSKTWKHKKHHAMHADPVAHADKLAKVAGLDDAQKAKVLAVFQDKNLDWDQRKAKIHDILTPAQQAKLKAAHHGKHGKHADPVAHADKLAKVAGLDDAQKAKVLAVFQDKSLDWGQRKAKINDILSPAQQAKLKAAHHGKHGKFTAEKAKLHADKMQDKLGITDAQKAQLQAAMTAGDWKKIKTILTADQYEELLRLKKSHGYHGKHGDHGKSCDHGDHGKDCGAHK